jgi:hypothetical protein
MVSAYTLELPIEHLPEKLTDKKRKQTSRLGHEIELFDENGEWLSEVIIPDDTSNVYHLDMTKLITKDAELNIMIRSFVLYLLPRYVPGTVYLYYKTLVYICKSIGGRKSLQSILNDLLIHSVQGPDAIGRCKRFVQFLVLHEYDGLSFEDAAEYLEAQNYSIKSNAYLMLFTMDQDYGPFTREELRVLNDSVSNEDLPLHIRTLLAICLNHGLRTIQLALLKHEDFVKDEKTDVKYLKVPRVKQGAVRRRMEFKYRLLDDRTANLIQQLIQMNEKHLPADIKSCDCPLFLRLQAFADCDSRYGTNVSKLRLYQGEKKSFAYHRGPTLAWLLNDYSQYIPLSPRTGVSLIFIPIVSVIRSVQMPCLMVSLRKKSPICLITVACYALSITSASHGKCGKCLRKLLKSGLNNGILPLHGVVLMTSKAICMAMKYLRSVLSHRLDAVDKIKPVMTSRP